MRFAVLVAAGLIGCGSDSADAPAATTDSSVTADAVPDSDSDSSAPSTDSAERDTAAPVDMGVVRSGGTLVAKGSRVADFAEDATHLYWAQQVDPTGGVFKVPLAGGEIVTLAKDRISPSSIVVDTDSIYWIEDGRKGTSDNKPPSVHKAPLAPGAVAELAVLPFAWKPTSLYADATTLFFLHPGTPGSLYRDGGIRRLAKAGGAVESVGEDILSAQRLHRDAAGFVYGWGNVNNDGGIVAVASDGTRTTLAPAGRVVDWVARVGTDVFWSYTGSFGWKLQKLAAGSTTPIELEAATAATSTYAAGCTGTDGVSIWWGDKREGFSIWKRPVAGGAATAIARGQKGCTALFVGASRVYWANSDGEILAEPR